MKNVCPRTEIAYEWKLRETLSSWLAVTVNFAKSSYVKYIAKNLPWNIISYVRIEEMGYELFYGGYKF